MQGFPGMAVGPFVIRHTLLIATGFFILAMRWHIMDYAMPRFQEVDNPQSFVPSAVMRVSTELQSAAFYFFQLQCF